MSDTPTCCPTCGAKDPLECICRRDCLKGCAAETNKSGGKMKRVPICMISDHATLRACDQEIDKQRAFYKSEIDAMMGRFDNLREQAKVMHKRVWDEIIGYLIVHKMVPSDYSRENQNIEIDDGVIFLTKNNDPNLKDKIDDLIKTFKKDFASL